MIEQGFSQQDKRKFWCEVISISKKLIDEFYPNDEDDQTQEESQGEETKNSGNGNSTE